MTGRQLIEGAMRLIGAIASGENASSAEGADGLAAANAMLDGWSNENLIIFHRVRETFTLTANQQSYTFGTGGDFNSARPMEINAAGILDSSGIETPLTLISEQEWAAIRLKSLAASYPEQLYHEKSYPLMTLKFWPLPQSAFSAVIYSLKPLTQIASLDTSLSLPQGYERALRFNLAIELAPEFGKSASAEVVKIADESKSSIKRKNSQKVLLTPDTAGLIPSGRFDIYTGGFD